MFKALNQAKAHINLENGIIEDDEPALGARDQGVVRKFIRPLAVI